MAPRPPSDRKAKLRAWKEEQRARRAAAMPLPHSDLRALFDRLGAVLDDGCDHTLRHTSAFLRSRGVDAERVIPWLAEYGGYCDCEVLGNVGEEWDDRERGFFEG